MQMEKLLSSFNPETGEVPGAHITTRHLSELRGCFADTIAYEVALAAGDPLLYTVSNVEYGGADGDLSYAVGVLMPGRIGPEYYMTKGHLHAWRAAAEIYIGLKGEGVMLLEAEADGASRMLPLRPHSAVHVPGHTAHRTMNTGTDPLIYIGVYPTRAGHDYAAIAAKNFRQIVVERNGRPVLLDRSALQAPSGSL
jgi:glucose-6-phosphate isomerase